MFSPGRVPRLIASFSTHRVFNRLPVMLRRLPLFLLLYTLACPPAPAAEPEPAPAEPVPAEPAPAAESAAAADWHRFRGPHLDGVSRESLAVDRWTAEGPPEKWRTDVGVGFSAVVIGGQRLVTLGNADNVDTVVCLDTATGERIWDHAYASPTDANEFEGGPTSTPTIEGDRVWTLSRQGDLFCFDLAGGAVQWSINVADAADVRIPTWGFAGSPLVVEDALILNVGDAGVAVDKATGAVLWSSDDKDAGYATPVPRTTASGTEVVIGSGRSFVGVDAATGRIRWRQRWLTTFGCNAADPILDGSRVLLSSAYNRGAALLDVAGEQADTLWKHKDFQTQLGGGVKLGQYVYGIHGDLARGGQLRCIRYDDGTVQWSDDRVEYGALSATEDHLLVLSQDGQLLVIEAAPEACRVKHHSRVLRGKCWTAPVLSGGQLYCRSADGQLVCLEAN